MTDGGTVKALLLSERLTNAPPPGATELNVTVHVEADPDVNVVGVHRSAETEGRTLIVPPLPVAFAFVPSGKDPNTPLIGNESNVALLVGERFAVTTATTPLPIAVLFIPAARHTIVPTPGAQVIVFPTDVSADPGVTLRETTSLGEYPSVHCSPAGAFEAAFSERLSDTELPLRADEEAKLSDGT